MIVTLFAAGLLLVPSVNAFWRLPCSKPVVNARIDPIISPNVPSGHSHTIMGSNAIGFSSTFDSLRGSNCSTCQVKDDKSAYWIPQLFYERQNKSFEAVPHGGMLVYYLQRSAANETVQAFPDGLVIFTGNPEARNNTGTPASQAISWLCINFNTPSVPQTPNIGNTNCPDGLRAQVFFPACWDGKNLDSPDHQSHMAYPDGIDNGQCPPTHPVHLVSLFYEVWFMPDNPSFFGGRFVLSNGDPTGYGLHGDFMNGWDSSVLSRAVETCTAQSGVIEDCPVFEDEGRFYTDDEMNACSAPNPIPEEMDDPGNLLSNLPGCVAISEGPEPAIPGAVVPGCVPGVASGQPVPSSGSNSSSAASSSAPSTASMSAGTASSMSMPPASSMSMPPASSTNAPTDGGSAASASASASQMSPSPSSAIASGSSVASPSSAIASGSSVASPSSAIASGSSVASPSSAIVSGSSAASPNQLAASTAQIPASTFTTDLAAASSVMQGASTDPVLAASSAPAMDPASTGAMSHGSVPSQSASDDNSEDNNNNCKRDYRGNLLDERRGDNTDSLSVHRRSRMQRRHGSRRSN